MASFGDASGELKHQKQKILNLSISDKKLTRLFFSADLSEEDSYFLNRAYEEQAALKFRYGIGVSAFTASGLGIFVFKFVQPVMRVLGMAIVGFSSHLFWNFMTSRRFNQLIEPYYEKYEIK